MTERRQLGVFGGTFDPIHLGHLTAADEVRIRLGLEKILFVPAGQPWLKANRAVTPSLHRLEMVRLAISGNPHFDLSTAEVDRPGSTYTVDTISMLRGQLGEDVDMLFLLGSDTLAGLPQWKEPQELIHLCRLAVFTRPGAPLPSLEALERAVPGISGRVVPVEVSEVDIGATEIRERVARGDPVTGLVLPAVERYIHEHGLYR